MARGVVKKRARVQVQKKKEAPFTEKKVKHGTHVERQSELTGTNNRTKQQQSGRGQGKEQQYI